MNEIGDYGVIGDCHSLALVGLDGSIDWCCFPRFDSPSVFGRMLDPLAGRFAVAPVGRATTTRAYLPATNVLETRFTTDTGVLEVTDCMVVGPFDPARPATVDAPHSILRRVRCTEGTVTAAVTIEPRIEYGTVTPRFLSISQTESHVVGGADALWVRSTQPLGNSHAALEAAWELNAGAEEWVEVEWTVAAGVSPHPGTDAGREMSIRFDETVSFWRDWFDTQCSYAGEHERRVHRAALLLKALTYAPTGAVVAAGTTSLPEWIGGERNWDYRFTWIRDATLTLTSLVVLGSLGEADAFKRWLERTGAGRPEDLQIMYRITGERMLPEVVLEHLSGHRDSAPVRIGNGAAGQLQLDSYGQLMEAANLFAKAGGTLTESNGEFLARVADLAANRWSEPDQGIWEIRDEPRHFVHSKLNCWSALDRACQLTVGGQLKGEAGRWRTERDAVAAWLRTEGAPDGWFVQAAGRSVPDAATLLVPALGFVPVADPTVTKTIEVVTSELADGALVHRYRDDDGLSGTEGSFLLCSFWLLDCLIHAGRLEDADEMIEALFAMSNDLGVFSEMVDPRSGAALGNTPQAFSHMAVVTSCESLTAARLGQLPSPEEPYVFAEAVITSRPGA